MTSMLRFAVAVVVVLCSFLISDPASGHGTPIHRRIVDAAARVAPSLADFLKATFGDNAADPATAPRLDGRTPFEWMSEGAEREDDTPRYYNHFYDPLSGNGLTEYASWAVFMYGSAPVPSRRWALEDHFAGTGGANIWTWQNARSYELAAFSANSKLEREQNFGRLFRSLGQVMHLIGDLSQPAHTRNDAHGYTIFKNFIEEYGMRNVNRLPYQAAYLNWTAAGFNRIEDFWDRNLYNGDPGALNNNQGETTLGLAEFINGNFLSEDSTYGELQTVSSGHRFPLPSLATSTNYDALRANPTLARRQVTLPNGKQVTRPYISKTGDGIPIDLHAGLTFTGYKHLASGGAGAMPARGVTLNDDPLLAQYHSIFIPAATSYTAGAMDYFFRGKLKIRVVWDDAQSRYKLEIANSSSQRFKGGAFTLYSDDENGNRSSLPLNLTTAWNSETALEPGASIEANFQPPAGSVAGYTVVYQGTIGTNEDGSPADPIDAGIAVAAQEFKILRVRIVWDPLSDIDLYLVDPNGAIIWFGNLASDLGELIVDNIGNTGPENITMKKLIDGDYQVWANYYFDHLNQNPGVDPDTPITVTMKTYFNSATELDTQTFTLTTGNEGEERPFGVTGPAVQPSWYIRKLLKVKDGKLIEH